MKKIIPGKKESNKLENMDEEKVKHLLLDEIKLD